MMEISRLANFGAGFEANCGFSLVKLSGQKILEEDLTRKCVIRQGIITTLVPKFRVGIRT